MIGEGAGSVEFGAVTMRSTGVRMHRLQRSRNTTLGWLERIHEANHRHPAGCLPLLIEGHPLGRVRPAFTAHLARWPEVFAVRERELSLAPDIDHPGVSVSERSAAVASVLQRLRDEGVIAGWRDELYPVASAPDAAPLLLVERAALPRLGFAGCGVHVNGFVCEQGQPVAMWVARRSMDKPTFPGELDQLVAGGQPAGLGLLENVIKECGEEAGIPPELARTARPASAISYCYETATGIRPDIIYCYDLALPAGYQPVNRDGEVDAFYLWPMDEVITRVRDTRAFKFNCALVVIDFLLRHGFIGPEEPDYLSLLRGLRGPPA